MSEYTGTWAAELPSDEARELALRLLATVEGRVEVSEGCEPWGLDPEADRVLGLILDGFGSARPVMQPTVLGSVASLLLAHGMARNNQALQMLAIEFAEADRNARDIHVTRRRLDML